MVKRICDRHLKMRTTRDFRYIEHIKAWNSRRPAVLKICGNIRFESRIRYVNAGRLSVENAKKTDVSQRNISAVGNLEHFAVGIAWVQHSASLNGEPWVPLK